MLPSEAESGHIVGEVEPSHCLERGEHAQATSVGTLPAARLRRVAEFRVLAGESCRQAAAELELRRRSCLRPSLHDHCLATVLEVKNARRVGVQVLYVNGVQCAVIPEPPLQPHSPARDHVRPPIRSGCRHPVVGRLSQPILDCRPLENAIVGLWDSVAVWYLGSIT